MAGEHTPGPWKATYADGGEDWIIHAIETPWQLAYLRNDGRAQWPLEANARLIAAAPDLLAFAELVLGHLNADTFQGDVPDEVHEAATMLIAKARGDA